ncbi:hypothetical protein GFY24_14480 [Nocardia sp. SYP-A9097]|uniref:LppU/SCO3897 family protein n=1 Tax=Nocardia sp. SYP-A9097 TaxID=2663237 RepID=UPI00129A10BF|nr:hypothetical protein [Nocardia sp. SYP-A9097]MRH88635.1 hypothetical protein [Nocardia sp. SYP-A9097]
MSRATEGPPEIRIPLYKRSATLMVAGAVLLASGLLGIGLSEALGSGVSVGDCVLASDFHKNRIAGLHPTSCGDPDAVYELAARVRSGHTCPDGELEKSVYFVLTEGLQTLCFAPDVIVGTCYRVPFGHDEKYEITPTDCADATSPGIPLRVTARFDGIVDGGRCSLVRSVVPRPARVVCWINHVPPR